MLHAVLTPPRSTVRALAVVGLLGLGTAACGHGADTTPAEAGVFDGGFPRAQLLDPHTCGSCHADHFNDWVNSMHALAADDPVFLAMNARGQRETDGGLGTFCVSCHAPMAVRDGKTTDGLNLASLPAAYKGVTCFFCHSISSVDGTHNAAVALSDDLVMRGEYSDPVPNIAHQAKYSTLQDITTTDSAAMCGACHDIAVPPQLDGDASAHIERTFAEWQTSGFGPAGNPPESCGTSGCHMIRSPAQKPIAQLTGAGSDLRPRYYHGHDFPAVDVQLPSGADAGADDAGVAIPTGVQNLLSNALIGDLCVTQLGAIRVVIDPFNVGHDFPSGASQDRRAWVEIVAYKGAQVVYQSGVVPFGSPGFDAQADPDLWLMRDCIFDPQGKEVNMFWQAATTDGNELPPSDPGFHVGQRVQFFPRSGEPLPGGVPDRVTMNLWLQPVGTEVLADLVDSGDLDPRVAAAMPTLPVPLTGDPSSPQLVWTAEAAADAGVYYRFVDNEGMTADCVGSLATPVPYPAPAHTMCSP
jgi:hypothetical protein